MSQKRAPRLDLNPSSADRWTTCTASPRFIMENWEKLPPRDTVYNMEGTTAHEVASAFLEGREPRKSDPYYCPVPVNEEMFWHGWNYMEYVEGLRKPGSRLLVEQKLPLWYMKERNAIVDAAVINDDSLHVIDFKYGEGVIVSPVENLQAAIYAMSVGLLSGSKPTNFPVFIHIYQPRGRAAEDGASHVWETTWLEVCKLTADMEALARDIAILEISELTFNPSEKACQWCPAKGFCAARQQHLTQDIEVLEVIDENKKHFPIAQSLSVAQIGAVLTHKAQIIKWLGDVEDYATVHLRGGGKLPGWKLVTSRGGNRQWSDPKKAAALLLQDTVLKREEVIEEKVIGPAAAEKLLGKRKFSPELTNLITKAPGVPVIAPESDKREALGGVLDDFEKLPEEKV